MLPLECSGGLCLVTDISFLFKLMLILRLLCCLKYRRLSQGRREEEDKEDEEEGEEIHLITPQNAICTIYVSSPVVKYFQ